MEELFLMESGLCDTGISNANYYICEAITSFIEDTNDFLYITEAEVELLSTKLKKFLESIITTLKSFSHELIQSITSSTRSAKFQKSLRRLREEIKEKKANGVKQVEIVDIWTLEETYLSYTKKMTSLANKISKTEYKTTMEMERDIAEMEALFEEADKKLTELSKVTKKVDVDKLEVFVEYEISGKSNVILSLDNCIDSVEKMKNNINLLKTKEAILGADILSKHVSFIKKITLKMSGFFKKWTTKFITVVVFIFA